MTTDSHTANKVRGQLVGDLYNETRDLPLEDIADWLTDSLLETQENGLLPAEAEFHVTADHSEERGVLHVTAQCEPDVCDRIDVSDTVPLTAMGLASAVFQLASAYNRIDLDQPDDVRFLQEIQVKCGERTAIMVGAMVQAF